MQTRGTLFGSRSAAMKAVEALHRLGVDPKRIDVLMPGADLKEFEQKAEVLHGQTGEGAWSAMGAGIGSFAGAAFVTALIPGLGAVLGIGAMAAAFIAGGLGGKAVGDAVEHSGLHDDVRDDTFMLYDALRREKAIVLVAIDDKTDPESVAAVLRAAGGETFDEAREGWWRERRDAEATWYAGKGYGDFSRAEKLFRRGYQAGFDPQYAGRSFESVAVKLRTHFTDFDENDFRRGYERAQEKQWNAQADASTAASSQNAPAGGISQPSTAAALPVVPGPVATPVVAPVLPTKETARLSTPSHPGG